MSKVLVTESSLAGIAAAIREKNGSSDTYMPGQMAAAIQAIPTGTTPTGTVNITQNGTVDVTDYASADVAVPNSYAAADEGKVVSNGALVAQTSRSSEITANGTYDTTLNDEVTVNISGGGGVPLIQKSEWNSLTLAQKRAYGLVAIQTANSGYERGNLVYGADYHGEVLQSGTAATSTSFTISEAGTFQLIVIALNSEASTYDLNVSATQNGISLTATTIDYHSYYSSGTNRRNYRIVSFEITAQSGDTIAISLSQYNNYTSFVWGLGNFELTTLENVVTTADATASGAYSDDAVVLYGTFNSREGGTISMDFVVANTTVTTNNPGTNYKSAYIFWFND